MTAARGRPVVVLAHDQAEALASLAKALLAVARTAVHPTVPGDDATAVYEGWALEQARLLLDLAASASPAIAARLVVDEQRWEISHRGQVLRLTLAQYRLLCELVRAAGCPVRTGRLAVVMFGSGYHDHDRVAAHVKRLRRRLLDQGVVEHRLEAVRGIGWRLVTGDSDVPQPPPPPEGPSTP